MHPKKIFKNLFFISKNFFFVSNNFFFGVGFQAARKKKEMDVLIEAAKFVETVLFYPFVFSFS